MLSLQEQDHLVDDRVVLLPVHEADARGNLAFDAQIAAVCQERGATRLLTLDRDFARFQGIRVIALDESPADV